MTIAEQWSRMFREALEIHERGSGSRLRRTQRRAAYLQHDLNRDFYDMVGQSERDVHDDVKAWDAKTVKKTYRKMRQDLANVHTGGDIRRVPTSDKHRIERAEEGWIAPAIVGGAVLGSAVVGTIGAHNGKFGPEAKEFADTKIIEPIKDTAVNAWDKAGKAIRKGLLDPKSRGKELQNDLKNE